MGSRWTPATRPRSRAGTITTGGEAHGLDESPSQLDPAAFAPRVPEDSMIAPLAMLVLLAALAGPSRASDLERASLSVTDGIVGGFVGRIPRVRLDARYDRVERAFRVVRRRS